MNDQSAAHVELPRSAYLDHTLRRARTAAEQRSHRYVTLEHLLLALLDDPDALKLLQDVGADTAVIRSTVADTVNNRMAPLVVPDGRTPNFSYKFDALFAGASQAAMAAGRREVDGAIALVAIAKDPESNASAILAANGFNPQAALQAIRMPTQPQQRPALPQKPVSPPVARDVQGRTQASVNGAPSRPLSIPQVAASLTSGNESMDDMLASVRNILEAEELKERRLPPRNLPSSPAAPPKIAQPRVEPKLRANGAADKPREHGAAKARGAEPGAGQGQQPQPLARVPNAGGFAEASAPAFDLEKTPKADKRNAQGRNAQRGKVGSVALLTKILEQIPRKARVAVPEIVEILLSKEEAALVFGSLSRRGQPQQGAEAEPACRAVTVRLSAPEGGFFIEGIAPETQWLLDRPAFLGEEAFGTWAWTVVPDDSGSYSLHVSMSARDVDENGVAGDINLPDQVIKVQVRGNFWRGFGRFVRSVLLLLAGSGLTVGAFYALKITGKLPH